MLNPLLSLWEQRVVGVHEGAEVGQLRREVGERIDAQPRQQEAGADEGLEQQPQIGETMLPTGVVRPGRMLDGGLRRCGGRRRLRRGESASLAFCLSRWNSKHRRLQAHQQIGAEDQFPPAFDTGRVRQPVIRPSKFVLGLLEAILDPGPQAEGVADAALNCSGEIRHDLPGRVAGQVKGIRRDLKVAS